MTILVIAEHNNAELNAATLNTVAAAAAIGGDIEVLGPQKSPDNHLAGAFYLAGR